MGEHVEITNVNVEGNSVSFNHNGESLVCEVVSPAQIKWAKLGKAEVGLTPEKKVNFIKSLEPRTTNNYQNNNYQKPESKFIPVSTMEILNEVTLDEIKVVYNELNAQDNKKCGASTLFLRPDGKYDAALYITTFVPRTPEGA